MKILVATDFSGPSERALAAALPLARRLGDSLVVAHALEPAPPGILLAGPLAAQDFTGGMRAAVERELAAAAARAKAFGIEVEPRLVEGRPATALLELAKELDVRLVVVGSHGRGPAGRLLSGSVADEIAAGTDRPVLVVRGEAPALAELSPSRPLRVFCALDASRASDAAVSFLRGLRRAGPCDVTFGHCYWPPGEYHRLGLYGPRNMAETDREVVDVVERELREKVGSLPGEGTISFRIGPSLGRPADPLARWARESGAELLVVGTHGRQGASRLWHGSVARDLIHVAELPVLCVPGTQLQPVPARIPQLQTILACTDLSPQGDRAVLHAWSQLSQGGRVHLCTVVERSGPVPASAFEAPPIDPQKRAALESRLRALVPPEAEASGVSTGTLVVEAASAAEGILQTAERLGVDSILLGSHGRTGAARALLGSVSEHVVRNANRPVTVVREPRES